MTKRGAKGLSSPAKATKKRKRGGQTNYSNALALRILAAVASGQTLREVCRAEGKPESTVRGWVLTNDRFAAQYARARQMQLESLADETLEISDDAANDWMERSGKDDAPGYVLNGDHVQRSRLRVDTRKWLLSKLHPQYGERVAVDHGAQDSLGEMLAELDGNTGRFRVAA